MGTGVGVLVGVGLGRGVGVAVGALVGEACGVALFAWLRCKKNIPKTVTMISAAARHTHATIKTTLLRFFSGGGAAFPGVPYP